MFVSPARRWSLCLLALVLLVVGSLVLAPAPALSANAVVGTGAPASCTESVFDTAFFAVQDSGGGTITFNCGAAAHTILFTTQKSVGAPTEIRGADRITLSGGNAVSLFQVSAGQALTLRDIMLTRGYGIFGAVENFGRLSVTSSQFAGNTATSSGGAIANHGELTVTDTLIAENMAGDQGGGIFTDGGATTITDSDVGGNTATNGGGGISAMDGVQLTVTSSQFSRNKTTATFGEGGAVRSGGTLAVAESTFAENNASRGGGMFVASGAATVASSTLGGNWAAYGGGIRHVGGDMTLTNVTLARNGYAPNGTRVTTGGGAISWDGGTASLAHVTIKDNWASYGGGFDHANGTTTLTNVTFSGNAAVGSGAFDQDGGSISLTNVTIANNAAPFFAGGIGNRGGALTLTNTLLANNSNPDTNQKTNCYKPIATSSFSLSSDVTCSFGSGRDTVDLALGPLADNGGVTHTHLPRSDSPAVDNGTGTGCPQTDQRGVERPQGLACDVGAVEVAPADADTATPTRTLSPIRTATPTATGTIHLSVTATATTHASPTATTGAPQRNTYLPLVTR